MKNSADKLLYIGCSGYYYSSWKNKFYPPKLPPKDWLQYYSSVFNTVELNSTFYRKPQLHALKKYATLTPDKFLFAVKMSRYITHILRLRNCSEAISELQDLVYNGLNGKCGAFLFQLPATFRFSEENMEAVLGSIPPMDSNVIEFRHESWWIPSVIKALRKYRITFCNVDYPGLKSHNMTSTDVFYLRLHGNPELFKSTYSDQALKGFAKEIPADTKTHFVYFNNTYYDGAYLNAASLRAILVKKKIFQYA